MQEILWVVIYEIIINCVSNILFLSKSEVINDKLILGNLSIRLPFELSDLKSSPLTLFPLHDNYIHSISDHTRHEGCMHT